MSAARPAPVADWVTIPDLFVDPFPTFERLRAEGGVHWVPAVGRYLVTSYDAVHTTEIDQTTFSANEQGSLMIRAMGHSMLRKDDPDHHLERRAWQPVLRPGVVRRTWMPKFEAAFEQVFAGFVARGPGADLITDFAAPYAAEGLRLVLGLHNATAADLTRWSQTMIDATGNYADDPAVWAAGERSYNEVDDALDEMLAYFAHHSDDTLLSALVQAGNQLPIESIRANVKMTIGGGLNEPRDAIGVAAYGLLTHPEQRELVRADPRRWDAVFDEAIRWIAPIGMYSRQTTRDVELAGVHLPAGAKLGICLLSANRDENHWPSPQRFDITRTGQGAHLAFGKGVHVCLGAWVARAEVAAVALPRLFSRLDNLQLHPQREPVLRGWVFRGLTSLPVTWTPSANQRVATPPSVAIVGSGPSGCFTAQAIRRALPDAEIDVIDRLPVPYGLVRHGVAPDHQGTKAVARQFARLFEHDGVRFVGDVTVTEEMVSKLREHYDAVVLATGRHGDATLTIPGANLAGVMGAGRVTRLLNGHPDEPCPAPALGQAVAVVGAGNVAMDVVRLLAKTPHALAGSDIDDDAHTRLTASLRTIHVLSRSQPVNAKFDPVMLREITELPGISHVVHGAEIGTDPRSELVASMRQIDSPRITVHWWFAVTPARLRGHDSVQSIEFAGRERTTEIAVDSVVTAIGFVPIAGQELAVVDDVAAASGRIEHGLYVAGWARRGPVGTIPLQRQDARDLVDTIVADLRGSSAKSGRVALADQFARATSYDGWLLIDAAESLAAPADRVRRKIIDTEQLRTIASTAVGQSETAAVTPKTSASTADRPALTVLFATESGTAELVAEELQHHLQDRFAVTVADLGQLDLDELPRTGVALVVSSTYGDGELPTSARGLHAELVASGLDLGGLRYAMFGLGDHSYTSTYSRGSELLDQALRGRGAHRFGEYGRHDAASAEAAPDAACRWADQTLAQVLAQN